MLTARARPRFQAIFLSGASVLHLLFSGTENKNVPNLLITFLRPYLAVKT